MQKDMSGKAEVALNGITVPAGMLSEVSTEITEGTRTKDTLAGTVEYPNGMIDTAKVTFTVYPESMDWLAKNIFPDYYTAGSGTQTTGQMLFGGDQCPSLEGTPVNIHYVCDNTDNNDILIFNGLVKLDLSMTYNKDDVLSVPVEIWALPRELDGARGRIGTGDLTAPSHWDAATGATVVNT